MYSSRHLHWRLNGAFVCLLARYAQWLGWDSEQSHILSNLLIRFQRTHLELFDGSIRLPPVYVSCPKVRYLSFVKTADSRWTDSLSVHAAPLSHEGLHILEARMRWP